MAAALLRGAALGLLLEAVFFFFLTAALAPPVLAFFFGALPAFFFEALAVFFFEALPAFLRGAALARFFLEAFFLADFLAIVRFSGSARRRPAALRVVGGALI